jgi:DNA end-binding protein Ku
MPDEDEVAAEAYVVLRDALKESNRIGLGQIVARGQASVVALRPMGKGLAIDTLRYADELQNPATYFNDVPDSKPDKELLSLATELIERKAKPFDPKAFKNQYDVALRELIDAKLEHRKPREIEEPQLGAKVINLMDALKKSIGSASRGAAAPAKGKATTKKRAAEESAPAARKTSAKGRRTRAA